MRRHLAFFVPLLAACTAKQPPREESKQEGTRTQPVDSTAPPETSPHGPGSEPSQLAGEPFDVPAWPEPPELKQDESCPLVIEPGVRLGGVAIGMTLEQLTQTGLPIEADERGDVVFATVDAQRVMLCDNRVTSTWVEDIRLAPDCLELEGGKLDRTVGREELASRLGGCTEQHLTGGTTADCKGGVAISYGMGDWLSLRVLRNGDSIQDDCAMVLDDGSLLPIEEEQLGQFVQDVANLSQLSGYWHVTQPDRKPLRLLLPESLRHHALEPFRQFGQEVVYLDGPTDPPHIEFVSIRMSETRAEVKFRYAVEGVAGTVSYRKRYDTWSQESVEVVER